MNHLIIWKDYRLFFGSHPRPVNEHSHPLVQLVLAIKDPFLFKVDKGTWRKKRGLLIAPNYTHECDAKNVPIISLDIDPESNLGEWVLSNQLNNRSLLDYPSEELSPFDFDQFSENLDNQDWTAIRAMINNTFSYSHTGQNSQKDDRIQRVLDFISKYIDKKITTEKLTEVAHLSESRLIHLFKEEMGLTIRNYILWYRLQIAFNSILEGTSLTTASHEAGFSDQAHMTRTFKKMIGVPPSLITKYSKFVQVSFPL